MKFRVMGTPTGYRVLAPWGAYIGPVFTDSIEAHRWVREQHDKGAWRK